MISCSDGTGPLKELRLSGTVTDFGTKAPLAGAKVTLETIEFLLVPSVPFDSTTADAQGRYSMVYPVGQQCVEILRLRVDATGSGPAYTNGASGNSVKYILSSQVLNIVARRL